MVRGLLIALGLLALLILLLRAQRRSPALQYLYFCRFPLLVGAALAAFPFVAVFGARALLANLFSLSPGGIVLVTGLALLTAWVVMITLELIVRYGPDRFETLPLPVPRWIRRFRAVLTSLLALPVIGMALALSPPPLGRNLWAALLGVLAALACLLLTLAGHVMLRNPSTPPPDLLLPVGRLFGRLPSLRRWRPRRGSRRRPRPGYVDPEGRFLPGHLLGLNILLVNLGLYGLGFLLLRPDRGGMPSLGYLLLLLVLAGWSLAGLSFWLDRYRVPVLTLLLVASFLAGQVFDIDHYYRLSRQAAPAAPAPAQAFRAAERAAPEPERPVVVVAASGGGITASLWTARVLTALQREVGEDFTRSIRLVSSVSGGSVGTMFFLDRFTERGYPPPAALDSLVEAAGRSSLEAVGWGVAYPDLWRIFFPFLLRDPTLDRGWALEQSWKRGLAHPEATLSGWREGMRRGWLPAVVLNATVVETGERFLITPLELPRTFRARLFDATYPGADLPVVTAARLSATFPWVSPITRALAPDGRPATPGLHLGDGGYYDNFGVVTAVDWLRSLSPGQREELRRRGVLLVLIRAFPEKDGRALSPVEHRGWLYAAAGPVIALLNARASTQSFRNSLDLDLLRQAWTANGIPLAVAAFELRQEAPLSWKLTPEERRAILDGWEEESNRRALAAVRRLFGRG